jgi:hypothetical protein
MMIFTSRQSGGIVPAGLRIGREPRGVLLLIVLSMLTLFMMLGTTYMVVTSRARATARAFSRASAAQETATGAAGRRLVDDAFRILARGTTDAACIEAALRTGDDLLGDKYGKTLPAPNVRGRYGRIATFTQLPGGLLKLTLAANGVALPPASVNGRVATLTFPGLCRSRRILLAAGSPQATTEITIAAVSPVDGTEITVADLQRGIAATSNDPNSIHVVINGREFVGDSSIPQLPLAGLDTNEPYDGFGDDPNQVGVMSDPYLASLVATDATGQPFDVYDNTTNPDMSILPEVAVRKMSFFRVDDQSVTPEVDNDADGVLDSKWIDVGFPVMRADDGTTYRAQAAYLVLDLDSRLSLNAHGSPFQLEAMLTAAGAATHSWPLEGSTLPGGVTDQQFSELAYGSGYGPAEVRIWDLFFNRPGWLPAPADQADQDAATEADRRGRGFFDGLPQAENTAAPLQKRPSVQINNIPGRYGLDSANLNNVIAAGEAEVNDRLSMIRDENRHPDHVAQGGARFPKSVADSWRVGPGITELDQYSTPSDLSGRMKVIADSQAIGDGLVSKMWYVKPQGYWLGDTTDDPYEIRLGRHSSFDNPFLPDELERVLRVYDWDASQLPTRLSALLGSDAERLRFLLTTDSWDSTAVVGDTWRQIENVLTSRPFDPAMLADLLGPELMTGRRLDLNRQIDLADGTGPARREALCRNLYTLLWTLVDDPSGAPPSSAVCQSIAQWAVNVVDIRDADSTMSVFFFDEDPTDGWDFDVTTSPFVIGLERPEVLITEALCWKNEDGDEGGVHVVLHHPWAAKALDGDNLLPYDQNGNAIPGPDPLDPDAVAMELAARDPGGVPMNEVDLALLGGGDADSPVWRMRLGASATASIIRFDLIDPSAITIDPAAPQYSSDDPDPQARFMPPDGWLCITGNRGTSVAQNPQVAGGLPQLVINLTDGLPSGPLPSSAAGTTDQVILLERLADPQLPYQPDPSQANFNPYIEVDRIESVPVADRTEVAQNSDVPRQYYAATRRELTGTTSGRFWQQQFDEGTLTTIADPNNYDATNEDQLDTLSPPGGSRVAWFPWLNRPFVSPVELALVPTSLVEFDANGQRFRSRLLEDYAGFTGNGWLDEATVGLATRVGVANAEVLVNDLFQATIVPSRFADLATSLADPMGYLNPGTGLEWLAINHLSSWREPGRVNLNTVTDDRVWDAAVRRVPRPSNVTSPADDLDRSDAGFGLPATPDPNLPPRPAETLLDLYGLDQGASAVFPDPVGTPGQEPGDNPQLCCLTAGRLANVATNRSNVFAIWVTVGFFECFPNGNFVMIKDGNGNDIPKELGSDTGNASRHRGFYIFDRSIPVGYVTGRDLNLDDAVRLRRIIQ